MSKLSRFAANFTLTAAGVGVIIGAFSSWTVGVYSNTAAAATAAIGIGLYVREIAERAAERDRKTLEAERTRKAFDLDRP